MANSSRVKSAERTLDVLDLLAHSRGPLTTLEVSQALEMPKSTTHHLLNVMQDRSFVSYWRDQRVWTLGVAALEVGSAYLRAGGPLIREGAPFLHQLVERTGATSHIALLQGTDVVYVDKREPQSNGIRLVTEVGTRLPAHLTAVGRAVLSGLDENELASIYAGYGWPSRTGPGPDSLMALCQLLDRARADGYAEESGAVTTGIACIASPLRTPRGGTAAAIGISFMAGATTEESWESLRAAVTSAAVEFSAAFTAV